MTRKELENKIIKLFTERVKPFGFNSIEMGTLDEHYADFEFLQNNVLYTYTLLFNKPNYLEYGNFVTISYKEISEEYKKLDIEFEDKNWNVFVIPMDTFLHPENIGGYRNTGRFIETRLNDQLIKDKNVEELTNELFNFYFKPVIEKIIPNTNSLLNADKILNDIDWTNDEGVTKPKLRIYSTSLVHQVLAGVLVAKAVNKNNFNALLNKYLDYSNKFESGKIKEIDLLREQVRRWGT